MANKFLFLLWGVFILFPSCSREGNRRSKEVTSTFDHDIQDSIVPWSHDEFNDKGFSFAIFSDLTGGERPGVFDKAITHINRLNPEFVINVGDLIEGGTKDSTDWVRQWEAFDDRARKIRSPLFYVSGNHDATGELSQQIWKERIGPLYYYFIYKNNLFLVLNTEDNSVEEMNRLEQERTKAISIYKKEGVEAFEQTLYFKSPLSKYGNISSEQSKYFLKVIKQHVDVEHTFIFLHKPIWEKTNEQEFKKIEEGLKDRKYTVFNGHTHMFNYEQRLGNDYINLGTTGGSQVVDKGNSFDHITWVNCNKGDVSISHLKLDGVLNKKGL